MFNRRMRKNVAERKVRSDKKREVKPNIPTALRTEIERLAFILDAPIKDVGQRLSYEGVHNSDVIERLSPYFQRDVRSGGTLYFGSYDNESLRIAPDEGERHRISIRFPASEIADIDLLAHTLNVPVSRAVAILLDVSIHNVDILQTVMRLCNKRTTQDRVITLELRMLMRFVNGDNTNKEPPDEVIIDGYKITRNGRIKRRMKTEDELDALRKKLNGEKRFFEDHPPLPTRDRNE